MCPIAGHALQNQRILLGKNHYKSVIRFDVKSRETIGCNNISLVGVNSWHYKGKYPYIGREEAPKDFVIPFGCEEQ